MGYEPGDEHLFTQGESIDERYWYPCYDSPNEKFTTEITCHVPDGMTGALQWPAGFGGQGRRRIDGLSLVARSSRTPITWSPWSPAISKRSKTSTKTSRWPFTRRLRTSMRPPNSFRDTRDIMDFYESEIGVPFPWVKYYQVMVQDFMEGGMENTSITTLDREDPVHRRDGKHPQQPGIGRA